MNPWATLYTQWDAWAYTIAIVLVFPLFGRFLYGQLTSAEVDTRASKKTEIYIAIIAMEWLFCGLIFFLMHRHSITLTDLGERLGILWRTIVASVALLAALVILVIQNVHQLQKTPSGEVEKGLGRGRHFYPYSRTELWIFPLLAMTTGTCEELIFRGWLVNFLGGFTHSIWIGIVLGSVAFGIGHAHQGPKGMLTTGLLGLIFGAIFVITSSLICVQVLHVAINLVNGLAGAYAVSLLRPPTQSSLGAT